MTDSWNKETEAVAALKPKKILFMCVNNSARSILAEAIARHYAPAGTVIISGGSEPLSVRPQALAVLRESGISTEGLYSKSIEQIGKMELDLVVTLCAEEVCPFFPGKVQRMHWGLPDPAAVEGTDDEKLAAFRAVRDELQVRIKTLLSV